MGKIRVAVAGAKGRMGREAVKMILDDEALAFVRGIDRTENGVDVGEAIGIGTIGVTFSNAIEDVLLKDKPDVLIDLTHPDAGKRHTRLALEYGVRPVVGTTGWTPQEIADVDKLSRDRHIGAVIAPNFAIGAVLMMKFAQTAAKYMPHVEIIEMHHDQKLDAPSGTAMKTAELIAQNRRELKQGHPNEVEQLEGARGGYYDGLRVHSVRLPGLVAHQQVLFGGPGQTLTLRHDSLDRQSFMPGVNLAVKKVMQLGHLVYGLEHLLDD
ncbi:4-hydroxy-tetrahydrodipicolinate reductase [Numidum massiliense]|uniref:4-hydroxy-tetrahydrodipicolinate reductase n=1 Tax=Numidum massiliense TaxID=1522315 RepID=UPI0006D58C3F|nr:4-hydroxy-tetrahydrodipicolinate reductase [Numidum massiliense]